MATFQVPQFIEEKSKIVGVLTLAQFGYLAVGGALVFIGFYLFSFFLWVMTSVIVVGIAVAVAFVKVNGMPLPSVLAAGFAFLWRPHQYTWQRAMAETTLDVADVEKLETIRKSMSFQDKLKSLAANVMTGKLNPFREHSDNGDGNEQFQVVSFLTGEKKMARRVDYSDGKK